MLKNLNALVLVFSAILSCVSIQAQEKARPEFQLSVQEKRSLVVKAMEIKKGDTIDNITNRLGKPTFDQTFSPKENTKFLFRSLRYYLVKWKLNLVKLESDELIDIHLNESNQVESIYIRVNLKGF